MLSSLEMSFAKLTHLWMGCEFMNTASLKISENMQNASKFFYGM